MNRFYFLFIIVLGCFAANAFSSRLVRDVKVVADTTTPVQILNAERLTVKNTDQNSVQILSGNVRLRQGTALFDCDSCIINKTKNIFEAFGRVHINDSDTAHIYSNKLLYQIDKRTAFFTGNVRMTDGQATLTTNNLEYDMNTRIGIYKNGGKVVNKKSVLTSKEGIYYADIRDIYFKKKVELKDPAFYLKSDSLLYNTELQTARFITDTYIRDSSGRVIRTSEGSYDLKGGNAQFTQRTTIEDGALTVTGDQIANDDKAGVVQIRGRGVLKDTAKGLSILANEIFVNKKTEAFLATVKPLMIIKQEKDSIYITADTLFSARLSDLTRVHDSLHRYDTLKAGDSTNRYFEAFRNVRVFTDSVQSVSDSLYYSFRDTSFQLFQNPIVWSQGSQITGDTIFLYTRNKQADKVKVFNNSYLVQQVEPGYYNQVKSKRMDGFFVAGVIDSVRAKGVAESIYFLQDDDSAYTGINQTKSELMDVFFKQGELNRVVFRSSVEGTLWPIRQKTPKEMQLPSFRWLEARRPKTKFELFQ
ncbi:lipopolysaccharide transport protein LptA [Cnuella takakiae]|uniref:Lipopolysaccharide transport protein LptA n=1 Tax=Cnuella takakiae TaxID=1302690 RepID=A0A1M4UP05_9BACT|nr:OstA-like protein [Cnuella takakiae]SHE58502.1 lipopolysaccharide transport protein LptA [Cnuella takakiae]